MVFVQRLLRQGAMKHKLEIFRLRQLAFPSRLHPHRSIKPATDLTGAECVPCTMTYPFATLDKSHALQILEQHEQVQRITR